MELQEDLRLARSAALEAGKSIAARFGQPGAVRYKSPDQPVTDADMEADRILRDLLLGLRPGYGWLSEEMAESVPRGEGRIWVVDPLDGTRNFVEGRPEFAVCVALWDSGVPVIGVIYSVMTGRMYSALAGQGAYRDDLPLSSQVFSAEQPRLVASEGEMLGGSLAALADRFDVKLLGSTALKMMNVAEGGSDLYVSTTNKGVWDVCAGCVIASEAGAVIRDLSGSRLDLSRLDQTIRGLIVVGRGGDVTIPGIVDLIRAAD